MSVLRGPSLSSGEQLILQAFPSDLSFSPKVGVALGRGGLLYSHNGRPGKSYVPEGALHPYCHIPSADSIQGAAGFKGGTETGHSTQVGSGRQMMVDDSGVNWRSVPGQLRVLGSAGGRGKRRGEQVGRRGKQHPQNVMIE